MMRAMSLLLMAPMVYAQWPPTPPNPWVPPAPGKKGPCGGTQTAKQMVEKIDLTGQVHVMTGADVGLGLEAAIAVATKKAHVIMLSYDPSGQGADAAAKIRQAGGKVDVVPIDLSKFSSVRNAAKQVLTLAPEIDVLQNDAGIACEDPTGKTKGCVHASFITDDGFERVIETDYLGHFLLTELLLPAIRKRQGRIVNVASSASQYVCNFMGYENSMYCTMNENVLQHVVTTAPKGQNGFGGPANNYGAAKYMQVWHAFELSNREHVNHVTAYSVHPGVVKTAMTDDVPKMTLMQWCASDGQLVCPFTTEEGAATQTYLSVQPKSDLKKGKYYYFCAVQSGALESRNSDAKYSKDLYAKSRAWVGLPPDGPTPPPGPVPPRPPPAPPAPTKYGCTNSKCTPDAGGVTKEICVAHCN